MSPTVRDRLAAATVFLLAAASAHAQVSCSNPDNLCTGDPCVIGDVAVERQCTVDFRPRTVQVRGRLRLPDLGELDLKAGTFQVDRNGTINVEHTEKGGYGGYVQIETTGAIEIE